MKNNEMDSKIRYERQMELKGHTDLVISIVYFPSPHFKIVGCSLDQTSKVFCSKTGKLLKTNEDHKIGSQGFVNQVIILQDDIFVTCGRDSRICGYSILPPFKRLKKVPLNSGAIYQMLPLNDDLIVLTTEGGKLFILSYEKETIVKRLNNQSNCIDATNLIRSINFPNCFYMNLGGISAPNSEKTYYVKLIDYQKNKEILKIEEKSVGTSLLWTVCVFRNSKKDEILVVGGDTRLIYMYNLGQELENNEQAIIKHRVQKETKNQIKFLTCFRNEYLIAGTNNGNIHIFDVSKEQERKNKYYELKEILDCVVHTPGKGVFEVLLMEEKEKSLRKQKNYVEIVSCSWGKTNQLLISKIYGLKFNEVSEYEKEDMIERISFLVHDFEQWVQQDSEEKYFVKICLKNIKLENINKCFLRM